MARLLIVDDEQMLRRSLRRVLEGAGHVVLEAADVGQARRVLGAEPVELVLCDVNMPGGSGLELVRSVAGDGSQTAIVMLTGVDDPAVAEEAMTIGADGYLVKPVERNEVLVSVASSLRRRELELSRRQYVQELEDKISVRTSALHGVLRRLEATTASAENAERTAVERLVVALTIRSEETGAHIQRVGQYAALLWRMCGADGFTEEQVRLAAMLHDVGKIGVPDAILLKPGPLSDDELRIIRRHPMLGNTLLADGSSPALTLGAQVALAHHERWDGGGYPQGLCDDQIPLGGRVVAIADVFDALTNDRVYRRGMSVRSAIELMSEERGSQFDPTLLELFFSVRGEVETIRTALPDPALAMS